jgi:CRISPR/Cas system type I-B associated protein Csh2 (Cas7 group RAMP superfamily)
MNAFAVTPRDVLDLQNAIQTMGQAVSYITAAAPSTPRSVQARVRYVTATELANAIEQYALELTFDARDFASVAPLKGDSVIVDEGRRGIMQVREVRGSGQLIAYKCGVQG